MPVSVKKSMRTLNIGTQEASLQEIEGLRCRCGRRLAWYEEHEEESESRAECRCGMVYVASEAIVRIEGAEQQE